jgi:vacuolar-type H+-ATPase subunit F/Vma7
MARIAALGDRQRIQTLVLAGAEAHPANTTDEVVQAWAQLDADVAVLILTPEAAGTLAGRLPERRDVLVAVLP